MLLNTKFRFTPTGVGKTSSAFYPPIRGAVHPHGCGENNPGTRGSIFHLGSPPRVWGKPPSGGTAGANRRFTPTGVGKTKSRIIPIGLIEVHPHGCGENAMGAISEPSFSGSPPRVWGKRPHAGCDGQSCRFTPTGVGKTALSGEGVSQSAVHPHGCGENVPEGAGSPPFLGSPPRVWGKRGCWQALGDCQGFTPTGVGKTLR